MVANLRTAVKLSLTLALIAVIASLGGLFLIDLYRDSDTIKAVWFVNDLITLVLAVPILLLAVYYAQKGSLKAQLIWIGSIWYMLYNYVFYLYGAQFNNFFLLYILLFSLSVYALITTITNLNVNLLEKSIKERAPYRAISGFLFSFAFALGAPKINKNIIKSTGTHFVLNSGYGIYAYCLMCVVLVLHLIYHEVNSAILGISRFFA